MAEKEAGADDRSMSEILASIRKIVNDEEANRRSVEAARAQAEPAREAGVFVLTGEMRAPDAGAASAPAATAPEAVPDEVEEIEPLALSPADQVSAPKIEAAEAHGYDVEMAVDPDEEDVALAADDAALEQDEAFVGLSEEDVEDIVRRVVREELQGPIGQQISRKVKRLIRDEVSKALAEEESLL